MGKRILAKRDNDAREATQVTPACDWLTRQECGVGAEAFDGGVSALMWKRETAGYPHSYPFDEPSPSASAAMILDCRYGP